MLEMGVLPEVAAATSATMIWFTSCSASVVFISFGAVQVRYRCVCCVAKCGVGRWQLHSFSALLRLEHQQSCGVRLLCTAEQPG